MNTFRPRIALLIWASQIVLFASAQITVDPMGPASICGSPTLSVAITVGGVFNAGNVFTMELSDAAGSFAAPTDIGSLNGTVSGSIPCTFPVGITGGSGIAIRVVASDPPEVGTPYPLPISTVVPANAGVGAALSVCSNAPALSLFGALGGNPQPGGTWTAPGGMASSGIFDPMTSPPGCYTYTVIGAPPCVDASASVCVMVDQQANAGSSGSLTVCSNSPPVSMFDYLGGTPQPGGTWGGPSPVVGGMYDPPTMNPGIYTYTVSGSGACANAAASVLVTENMQPNAGSNGTALVCSSGAPFLLRDSLGGNPQAGGFWSGPSPVAGGIYNASLMASGQYTYTLVGIFPCMNATAYVSVFEVGAQYPGISSSVNLCTNSDPVQLFDLLGGTPTGGGHWKAFDGSPHSGLFDPATDLPGCYRYVLDANGVCPADSASVCVAVTQEPDAGTSATEVVCANGSPFMMIDLLGGTPQPSGTWSSAGGPHPGIFNPSVDGPGCFNYTVLGVAPCPNDVAILCIQLDPCLGTGRDPNTNANGVLRIVSGWNTDHPVVAIPQDQATEMTLGIVDAMGRVLSVRAVRSGAAQCTLDLSAYSPGLYTITLLDGSQRHALRIRKDR